MNMKILRFICFIFLTIGFVASADDLKSQRIQPKPGEESVWDYPRPPKAEETWKEVRIVYDGVVIAKTNRAIRVLQTGHPPVYYVPPDDIQMKFLVASSKTSKCEFKGTAFYYDVKGKTKESKNAAWSYPDPTPGYEMIRNYVAFYPQLMDACYVNNERVLPEPGEYFGGWITHEILGPFAGSN
jgi:uncharacterized protein (DUF427 family)